MPTHQDAPHADRQPSGRPVAPRRVAKHRSSRRNATRRTQLIGLTAALAAAAGTTTVGLSSSATGPANPSGSTGLNPSQADALTAARIDRRDLGSRDASRIDLSLAATQKAAAETAAKQRAARLAANATLTQRRSLALAAAKAAAAKKAAANAKALAAAKQEALAKAAAIKAAPKAALPTTGYRLTARFGQAGSRWARDHTGLDFAAPMGTPVRSVMAGEVIQAAFAGAYGRQVKVRHADGTVTSYSHMSALDVSVGDSVEAGTVVGRVGMTGNTTGPHVHLEVLPNGGDPIDPGPWLRERGVNP